MLHAAFLRAPHAHADILSVDCSAAQDERESRLYGSRYSGAYDPRRRVTHLAGLRSEEQYPLAVGRVRWQGEPVVMVVAETRAKAEDAIEALPLNMPGGGDRYLAGTRPGCTAHSRKF